MLVVITLLGLKSNLQNNRYMWRSQTAACCKMPGGRLDEGWMRGDRLCRRCLCDAPLTAGALDNKCWGDALVAGVEFRLAVALGWLEVASGAAQKALPEILEEVSGEAHVDPGVTAAVEAGEEHGDDEGHGCGSGQRQGCYCAAETTQMKDFTLFYLWFPTNNGVSGCTFFYFLSMNSDENVLKLIHWSYAHWSNDAFQPW